MREKICRYCYNKNTCETYAEIKDIATLGMTECANLKYLVTERSCLNCTYQDIFESEHEMLACRCKKTGEVTRRIYGGNGCKDFEVLDGGVFIETPRSELHYERKNNESN